MQQESALVHAVVEPALRIEGISKTFAGNRALSSLDLLVEVGEVHALLGENGSGKSTLIKILSGYHAPDEGGSITVGGAALDPGSPDASHARGLRFVHQNLGLIDTCSVAENLAAGFGFPTRWGTISTRRLRARTRESLDRIGLQLDPDRMVATLSPAERTELAIARALQTEDGKTIKLLVLDEPTATLPESEVERLLGLVKSVAAAGTGVLYVTHRLEEVFVSASVATVLRDGVEVITTPVDGLTRVALVNYLIGDEFEPVQQESDALDLTHEEPMLDVNELRTDELRGVSLNIRPGEVVGVAGITGSGREQLLGAVFGASSRSSGEVKIGGALMPPQRPSTCIEAGTAYIPANRQRDGGFMEFSARENFGIGDLRPYWRTPRLSRRLEQKSATEWFERLRVRPERATEMLFASFSGGNQQKIIFAKWLRREPRLFLLDEPTQGVDVATKAFLHRQLLEAASHGAAVLVSSSDVDELVALCQRVIVLRQGRVVSELVGAANSANNISRETLGITEMKVS